MATPTATAPRARRAPAQPVETDFELEEHPLDDPDAPTAEDQVAPADVEAAMDEFADLEIVEDKDIEISLPVIERARVVYVGSHPRRSVSLRGTMVVETWEREPAEPPSKAFPKGKPALMGHSKSPSVEHGITSYDFARLDNGGRIITVRRMGATGNQSIDTRCLNRQWTLVEHPEHLRLFKRMRDAAGQHEFEVLVPKAHKVTFENYVADKERLIGRHNTEADYIQGKRETPE